MSEAFDAHDEVLHTGSILDELLLAYGPESIPTPADEAAVHDRRLAQPPRAALRRKAVARAKERRVAPADRRLIQRRSPIANSDAPVPTAVAAASVRVVPAAVAPLPEPVPAQVHREAQVPAPVGCQTSAFVTAIGRGQGADADAAPAESADRSQRDLQALLPAEPFGDYLEVESKWDAFEAATGETPATLDPADEALLDGGFSLRRRPRRR